jgi:hypothetical protein
MFHKSYIATAKAGYPLALLEVGSGGRWQLPDLEFEIGSSVICSPKFI